MVEPWHPNPANDAKIMTLLIHHINCMWKSYYKKEHKICNKKMFCLFERNVIKKRCIMRVDASDKRYIMRVALGWLMGNSLIA